ncbi:IclR family transcriptional regulator C-terminal domain-containing protein [Streptomyces sp. NPDC048342]|uniref:IclR family transcriptional regulator domain-containing protein n=1 Tax=unclassified Streptomyces TaxID=2593676 RepID=UPI0034418F5D
MTVSALRGSPRSAAWICSYTWVAAAVAVRARFPARATAVDRAMPARRAETARAEAYVLLDGDREDGVTTPAAPVRDQSGRAVAGVSLAMHSGRRSTMAARRDLLPHLPAAARIEADPRITDPAPDAPLGSATHR